MKVHNGIKPFDGYWVGCQLNVELSILSSLYRKFKETLLAYNNCYSYATGEHIAISNSKFYNIEIQTNYNFDSVFVTKEYSETCDVDILIRQMKRWIRKKRFVYVGVDLFYLLPKTMCWNKFHWYHYTFITGYNNKKREVYVLEHTISEGYKEYAVPEERFIKALDSAEFETKIFTKILNKKKRLPGLNLMGLILNAKNIIDSIKAMEIVDLYVMNEYDYTEEYFMELNSQYLFITANHHISNKLLIQQLNKNGYLKTEEGYNLLIHLCEELINGWNCAKLSLYKCYKTKSDRGKYIMSLNVYIQQLFKKEVDMWNCFIDEILII